MKPNRCPENQAFDNAAMPAMEPMNNMDCCSRPACPGGVMMCQPVYECPQVNCCHRVINYEVPQV